MPKIDLSPIRVLSPNYLSSALSCSEEASDTSLLFNDASLTNDEATGSVLAFLDYTDSSTEPSLLSSDSIQTPVQPIHQPFSFACCDDRCIASISLLDLEVLKKSFTDRSRFDQQQFLLDVLRTSAYGTEGNNSRPFLLFGRSVCKAAFSKALGISQKRLQNAQCLHSTGFS